MNAATDPAALRRQRATLVEYLAQRAACEDWHGVRDAAADLEVIDGKLSMVAARSAR